MNAVQFVTKSLLAKIFGKYQKRPWNYFFFAAACIQIIIGEKIFHSRQIRAKLYWMPTHKLIHAKITKSTIKYVDDEDNKKKQLSVYMFYTPKRERFYHLTTCNSIHFISFSLVFSSIKFRCDELTVHAKNTYIWNTFIWMRYEMTK